MLSRSIDLEKQQSKSIHRSRSALPLLTRTDLDWTSKSPAIADAATALPLGSAYTDGESCGVRADGITSFSLIQNASDTRNGEALVIFQFDRLHVDGEDPSALPLVERKAT